MKKFKFTLLGSLFLFFSDHSLANIDTEIKKYEDARLAVNYQGEIGSFLQLLSAKLGIGYYSENINSSVKVIVKQDENNTISELISQVNNQLRDQHVLLNSFNNKVTIALVNKELNILQSPQYIGEINFNAPSQISSSSTSSVLAESSSTPISIESIPTIKEETVSQDVALLKEQEEKMNYIVSLSKDEKLLEKYKRAQPKYIVENKEKVKLSSIRSTKLSTFLVFEDNVNVADLKIEGKFQDIAKFGNLVAILHRQKEPPKTIKISKDNQIVIIRKAN